MKGTAVLWNCKIQGSQHMICLKNLRFSSCLRAKVRQQVPPGSARAPYAAAFLSDARQLEVDFLHHWTVVWLKLSGRVVIKSRGRGFSLATKRVALRLLLLENRRKIEPKEIPSGLIPRLLVVFTRQLEIFFFFFHRFIGYSSCNI